MRGFEANSVKNIEGKSITIIVHYKVYTPSLGFLLLELTS